MCVRLNERCMPAAFSEVGLPTGNLGSLARHPVWKEIAVVAGQCLGSVSQVVSFNGARFDVEGVSCSRFLEESLGFSSEGVEASVGVAESLDGSASYPGECVERCLYLLALVRRVELLMTW